LLHINNGGYPGATGTRAFALASVLISPKTRKFFSVNNLAVDYKQPSRWLQAPLDFVLSKSDINWITASRAAATQLTQVLRLNRAKMHVVPNGISPLVCSCKDEIPLLPISTDMNTVTACQIGHLEKRKGQRVLIEALSLLREQGRLRPNWLFVLEGVGPTGEDLKRQISRAGLAPQVQLIGRANCVLHLLRHSQLLIHPFRF
jgi:glycosyltransferase involved in cell wall biosynthesis